MQIVGQLLGAAVGASAGLLASALRTMVSSSYRNRDIEGTRRLRFVEADLVQQGVAVSAIEHRFQRHELVQRGPKRIDVGTVIDQPLRAMACSGLTTQGADQLAGHGQAGLVLELGQAKIGDPHLAPAVEQQIGRLDVAMDDPHLVGVFEHFGGLPGNRGHTLKIVVGACRMGRGQDHGCLCRSGGLTFLGDVCRHPEPVGLAIRAVAEVDDQRRQTLALDVLHGIKVHAAFGADGKHRDDMRMMQMGGRLRLVAKTLQLPGVDATGKGQDLEGDARRREIWSAS